MNTFVICMTVVAIVGIIGVTVYKCIQMVLDFNKRDSR